MEKYVGWWVGGCGWMDHLVVAVIEVVVDVDVDAVEEPMMGILSTPYA